MVSSVGGSSASRSPASSSGAAKGTHAGGAAKAAGAASKGTKAASNGVKARAAADTTRAKATAETARAARARVAADPTTQQIESRVRISATTPASATASTTATTTTPPAVDPKVRAEADKGFEAAKAGVAKADLPQSLGLPTALDAGMQKAWAGSLPGGVSQEQGGVLVEKKDGSYDFRAAQPGKAGSISLNYGDVKPGEKAVASAHTHPYDKTEGGHTNVAFSGTDLGNMVHHPNEVRTVQSGTNQFAAVPTKEFQARVAALDDAGRAALRTEMKGAYDKALATATGDFPARVDAAVRAVTQQYDLGYYTGTNGLLTR